MKRYIVHPTREVPFSAVVRFHQVPISECIDAGRFEDLLGRDIRGMKHLFPDRQKIKYPTPCKCGGIDTNGDGDCFRCGPSKLKLIPSNSEGTTP